MVCVTQQRKVQIWIGCRDQGIHYFLIFKTVPQRGSFWQPVTGHVEVGESDQEAALRELKEETGYTVDELIKIGEVEPSNGCMRNPTHIYLSFVSEQGEQQLDETELIEVVYRRPDEVDQMVERNDIWDSLTISAWAMARPRILHTEPYV